MDVALVPVRSVLKLDSGVDEFPGLCRDTGVVRAFHRRRLQHELPEGRKEGVLLLGKTCRAYWEPLAHPEVALIPPQCRSTKTPQNQVVVRVVPGIPDSEILEQKAVCTNNVICLGYHLLAVTDHAPCTIVPCPSAVTREEIICHVFQALCCHRHKNGLVLIVALRGRQVCIVISSDHEFFALGTLDDGRHDVL